MAPKDPLNSVAREFVNRLKDQIERTSALGRLSLWLEKRTMIHGRPYSFRGHEYQRDIIDDNHPNSGVIKPSQTGLSEGAARLCVGFLAVSPDTVAIYTMPTVNEALRFSKSRVDPIIRNSPYLTSLMQGGNDSASFKQIGSSQLFMAGTFGKALISIPTDLLINDEIDFSNPEVLITAESRLSHSRLHNEELDIRGIRRKFSTPTLPQMGISAFYENSDQRQRLVRCRHCDKWFWPEFLRHVTVRGFDGPFEELSYLEVQALDERGLLETAQLLCPHCRHGISKTNLQPHYRCWVAKYPTVRHARGWAVSPFDLPDYHSPSSLLRKMLEYKEQTGHFRNFTLGQAYADASNSVLPNTVARNASLRPIHPDLATGDFETLIGIDIGKTSWLVVGRPHGNELHVLWAEQIRISRNDEDGLYTTVVQRIEQFNAVKVVVDAMPYTDTMLRLQARFTPGQVLLCTYSVGEKRAVVFSLNERDHVLEANRTKSVDTLVKRLNTDRVKFAQMKEGPLIEGHLQGMKRVERVLDNGEVSADWVKSAPDHYFHALNYLNLAAMQTETKWAEAYLPSFTITPAYIGRQYLAENPEKSADPLNLFG